MAAGHGTGWHRVAASPGLRGFFAIRGAGWPVWGGAPRREVMVLGMGHGNHSGECNHAIFPRSSLQEAYEVLSRAYAKIGQKEKAEEAKNTCEAIRNSMSDTRKRQRRQ